jgi:hypothetical protein
VGEGQRVGVYKEKGGIEGGGKHGIFY